MKTTFPHARTLFFSLLCASVLNACGHTAQANSENPLPSTLTTAAHPNWLTNIIQEATTTPHLTRAIYRLSYQQRIYYMTLPGCCDRFSILYDAQGDKVCAPSGGFTGQGDGKCGEIDVRLLPKTQIWPKKSAESAQIMAK